MDSEVIRVEWEVYLGMDPNLHKLIGHPLYYTINPDNNRCVMWPSPPENVKILIRTE